jgi:hypothetical protein
MAADSGKRRRTHPDPKVLCLFPAGSERCHSHLRRGGRLARCAGAAHLSVNVNHSLTESLDKIVGKKGNEFAWNTGFGAS